MAQGSLPPACSPPPNGGRGSSGPHTAVDGHRIIADGWVQTGVRVGVGGQSMMTERWHVMVCVQRSTTVGQTVSLDRQVTVCVVHATATDGQTVTLDGQVRVRVVWGHARFTAARASTHP